MNDEIGWHIYLNANFIMMKLIFSSFRIYSRNFGTSSSWKFNSENGTRYTETQILWYKPEKVYEVVAKVNEYQEFLPWCTASKILTWTPSISETGTTKREKGSHSLHFDSIMTAELTIGYNALQESYISRVELEPYRKIQAISRDSRIFSRLINTWTFAPHVSGKACHVNFDIDFKFKSVLHSHLCGLFFEELVETMINAFKDRCEQLYPNDAASLISP